jgi:hypothetical protein
MRRLLFFLLAGTFCVAACLHLRSKSSGSFADVTLAICCEDYGSGIIYDRQFDFPTGAGLYSDVPVWGIDSALFFGAAVGFGFYAKRKLQEQEV